MPLIPFIATFFATLIFAFVDDIETGLLVGLLVAVVTLQLAWRRKHRELQQQLDDLQAQLKQPQTAAPAPEPAAWQADVVKPPPAVDSEPRIESAPADESVATTDGVYQPDAAAAGQAGAPRAGGQANAFDDFLRQLSERMVAYFTDGNIYVRIGILILFFGVAFLLKYAAENSAIPIELRFIGAAAGGLILLVFGWRLHLRKPIYALLLQGGGIGVIYITIFAAFRLADLLP